MSWIFNWQKIIYTECKWLKCDGKPTCPLFIIYTKCWLGTIWKEYGALNYYAIITSAQQHVCPYLLQISADSLSSEVSPLTGGLIASCSYMELKLGWFMDVIPRKAKEKNLFQWFWKGDLTFFVVNPIFVGFF